MPMDFPVPENINFIVRANFDWTYRIAETTQGMSYLATIMAWVKAQT